MAVEITPVKLGFGQCYILKGEGAVVVDAGVPGKLGDFLRGLGRASVAPKEVRLVVLTHGHFDHVGSARAIREATGAPLAMHAADADVLAGGAERLPPGVNAWGRLLAGLLRATGAAKKVPAASVDVVLGDDELPLHGYGIPGFILHTPGHTAGSVSVVLETGEAFVGDAAMNRFPLRLSPGAPIFADDLAAVFRSWKRLLEGGARTIYPGHGRPFPAEVLRRGAA